MSSLGAHAILLVLSVAGSNVLANFPILENLIDQITINPCPAE